MSGPTTPGVMRPETMQLLKTVWSKGNCMSYEGSLTPNSERERKILSERFCGDCAVKLECAVYSIESGAAPVNGSGALTATEKHKANEIVSSREKFNSFVSFVVENQDN